MSFSLETCLCFERTISWNSDLHLCTDCCWIDHVLQGWRCCIVPYCPKAEHNPKKDHKRVTDLCIVEKKESGQERCREGNCISTPIPQTLYYIDPDGKVSIDDRGSNCRIQLSMCCALTSCFSRLLQAKSWCCDILVWSLPPRNRRERAHE